MASNYWKERVEAEIKAKKALGKTLGQELEDLYTYHYNAIESDIDAFLNRYAEKNNIDPVEAKKRVDAFDVKAFEVKAKKYVEEKNFSSKANAELRLYNLRMKMKAHELLQYNLDLEMLALGEGERRLSERFLNQSYITELHRQAGLLGHGVPDKKRIEQLAQASINANFHGANWSDRVWKRQQALRQILQRDIESMLFRGQHPTKIVGRLRKEFDASKFEAERLAVTEMARVSTEAQRNAYEEFGYERYEFIAEPTACSICSGLDGKIFDVSEMMPGKNASPVHPHCHCTTGAVFKVKKLPKSVPKINNAKIEVHSNEGYNFKNYKDAESYATSKGVQYVNFSKMKPEWYNAILAHLDKIPEGARPVVLTDTKTLQTLTERKIKRNAKSYYGVTQYMSGMIKRIDGELIEFRDGSWVGFNSVSFKTLKDVEKAKASVEKLYFEKYGKNWSMLKTADETISHEFGHVIDNFNTASDNWEWKNIAKRWHEESNYDHLKSPSEAWADAVGLVWNKKNVPAYVEEYMTKYAVEKFNNPLLFK